MNSIEKLWEDVELTVCRVCVDSAHGRCLLSDNACALREHFASIVEAVDSTTSSTYAPYVEALRNRVCIQCDGTLPDGNCPRRDEVECALDRYYPLVIDAIEEGLHGNPIAIALSRR